MLFALAVVLAGLFAPADASACSCVPPGPACQMVFQTDAVFVGTVQSIDLFSEPGPPEIRNVTFEQKRVRFKVTEVFRGDVATEVYVVTGMGGGDCGYGFSIGTAYVVYGWNWAGRISTGICSRTGPVSEAGEDLAFLRSMSSVPSVKGKIYGTATYESRPATVGMPWERRPFADARLTLTSEGKTWTLTSGHDGTFSMDAAPGKYTATVSVPAGYYASLGWPDEFELTDPRGCLFADVYVRDDGRIRGRVVDANGKPIVGLAVGIGTADSRSSFGSFNAQRTNADGRFEFAKLDANDYIVSVDSPRIIGNRIESDHVVSERVPLSPRASIEIADLALPEASELSHVSGVVVDGDGAPVAGMSVSLILENGFRLYGPAVVTGSDGRFSFVTPAPGTFRVSVEDQRPGETAFSSVEVAGVPASSDSAPITVRLIKR